MAAKRVGCASKGEHLCVVFNSDAKRDEVVSTFVREGLLRRERVVCFTDQRHPDDVFHLWAMRGIDVDGALRNGQLSAATASDSYLASGSFDPDALIPQWGETAERALRDGFTGVRVVGAMEWATRGVAGAEKLRDYEQRIAREVFPNYPITGLCEFDLRYFDAKDLDWIVDLHPDGNLQADPLWEDNGTMLEWTFDPLGLKINGIVDIYSRSGFDDALDELLFRTQGNLTLDLAKLEYIDVRSMVMIANAAERVAPKRNLVIRNASPIVQQCMDIMHLSAAPGIRVER